MHEHEHRALRRLVKPLLIVVVSIAVGYAIVITVGAIDWATDGDALARLTWWQVFPLLAGLLLRQGLNAVPLQRFVPGLSWWHSVQNDLSAVLVATFTPPPADVALRVSMFRSWNINPVDGMAGVTLNMLTFYAVRFLSPAIGLAFLAWQGIERHQVYLALGCALVSGAILVGLILLTRGERMAVILGRAAARVIHRVKASVDEEVWVRSVVDFRGRMVETLRAGLALSTGSLVAMVLADGLVLLMALRFTATGSSSLTWIDILGAFLLAYPLTLMPLAGLGILDASLVAAYTSIAGPEAEAEIIAGLALWRIFTLAGPILLGLLAMTHWRRTDGRRTDGRRTDGPSPAGTA